jgi:hypothetical protein
MSTGTVFWIKGSPLAGALLQAWWVSAGEAYETSPNRFTSKWRLKVGLIIEFLASFVLWCLVYVFCFHQNKMHSTLTSSCNSGHGSKPNSTKCICDLNSTCNCCPSPRYPSYRGPARSTPSRSIPQTRWSHGVCRTGPARDASSRTSARARHRKPRCEERTIYRIEPILMFRWSASMTCDEC